MIALLLSLLPVTPRRRGSDDEYIAMLERSVEIDQRGGTILFRLAVVALLVAFGLAWARHAVHQDWVPRVLS